MAESVPAQVLILTSPRIGLSCQSRPRLGLSAPLLVLKEPELGLKCRIKAVKAFRGKTGPWLLTTRGLKVVHNTPLEQMAVGGASLQEGWGGWKPQLGSRTAGWEVKPSKL